MADRFARTMKRGRISSARGCASARSGRCSSRCRAAGTASTRSRTSIHSTIFPSGPLRAVSRRTFSISSGHCGRRSRSPGPAAAACRASIRAARARPEVRRPCGRIGISGSIPHSTAVPAIWITCASTAPTVRIRSSAGLRRMRRRAACTRSRCVRSAGRFPRISIRTTVPIPNGAASTATPTRRPISSSARRCIRRPRSRTGA